MSDKDLPLHEFNNALAQLDNAIAEMKKAPNPIASDFKLLSLMDEVHLLEKQLKSVEVKDD